MQIQSEYYSANSSSSSSTSGSNCTNEASGNHLAMAEGVSNNDPELQDASSSRVVAATAASASAAADSGLPSSPIDLSLQGRARSLPDQSSADDVEIDVEYAVDDEDANQDSSLDIEKSSALKQQSAKFDFVESALEGDPLARFMIVCNDQNVKWRELIDRHRDHQPPNRCGECQKDFRCKSALMMHYRTHTDERPYLCRICQKSFATKGNLKTHLSVHREAQQLLNSSSRSSETMPPTPTLPAPASQPAAMLSKPAIKATSFFSDDVPSRMLDRLMSSEYAKSLHSLSSLPMQEQLQPPQSEPLELTKSSTNCNSKTSSTIVLINHHQTSRSAAAAITCELCGKACSCRSALEIHMRTHTKEKPFLCGQCGKGFSTKGNMRQHELTHRRNFRQPELEASSRWSPPVQQSQPPPPPTPPQPPQLSFQQSSSLVPDDAASATTSTPLAPPSSQQSQQKSDGHRSRVCEHCNKECPTRSALDIHRRSHTGEKPYRCPGCAKRFSTHGNMQAHVRRHCPQTRATVAAQQSPTPPPPLPPHFLLPQAQPPPPPPPPHHHHLLYSLAAAAALRGASSMPTQPYVSPPPGFFLPPFAFGGPSSFLPGAANVASFGEFQLSASMAGSRV